MFELMDGSGRKVFRFDAANAALYIGAKGNEGDIIIYDSKGLDTFKLDGEADKALHIRGKVKDREYVLEFYRNNAALYVGAKHGKRGLIILRNGLGKETIKLDGRSGDIVLLGGDCAEEFEVAEDGVEPGSVMVVNEQNRLTLCRKAYDKKVIGIVSGAGDCRPGIVLGKKDSDDGKRVSITLTGKVYCKVDATYGAIEVGDLLTTSPTPGYAMKATDPAKAFGAIVGKALQPSRADRDLILCLAVLV